jgi:hypothetical protein
MKTEKQLKLEKLNKEREALLEEIATENKTKLEKAYQLELAEAKKAAKEIEKLLLRASASLNEAEEIADKHGLMFYSGISPVGQFFTPASRDKWNSKFPKIVEVKYQSLSKDDWDEADSLENITNWSESYSDNNDWEESQGGWHG